MHQPGDIFTIGPCTTSVKSEGRFLCAALAEPRIEPEIVFKMAAAPTPGMDESALLAALIGLLMV